MKRKSLIPLPIPVDLFTCPLPNRMNQAQISPSRGIPMKTMIIPIFSLPLLSHLIKQQRVRLHILY